jgi:hypothetical protein
MLCDGGARARDPQEADLTRLLTACGQPFQAAAAKELVPLLLACNVSSSIPGEYNITYAVANSARRSAATWRTLVVVAVCPPGEHRCADRVREWGSAWLKRHRDMEAGVGGA